MRISSQTEESMPFSHRILVVEDNPEAAKILCTVLRNTGYEADVAFDGKEALEKIRRDRPDLVLLDVVIPEVEGFDVCRIVKSDAEISNTAIIFLTVRSSPVEISEGFKLGADDYVTKPYERDVVLARVRKALRIKRLHDSLETENQELRDLTYTDVDTGLRNKRFLFERLQEEVERAQRYSFSLHCVAIAVDNFDQCVSDLGPDEARDLLAEIGMLIKRNTRSFDVASRFESETFVIILPHTPYEEAMAYAEKIRQEVGDLEGFGLYPAATATVSIGVTGCENGLPFECDGLLETAFSLLDDAIEAGGNRTHGCAMPPCNPKVS
ncbi:response regulator [Candidatus Hydrogenedentota bacterium]